MAVPQTPSPEAQRHTFRRRKQLEQDLDHVTQEMYRHNRELAETNQTLSLLRTIDTLVLESQDSLKVVSQRIAEAITSAIDYPFIGLLARPSLDDHTMGLYGWSAKNQQLPENLFGTKSAPRLQVDDDDWFLRASQPQLLSVADLDTATIARIFDCSQVIARGIKQHIPIKSLYCVQLVARGRVVGALVAGFYADVSQITPHDTARLDHLSEPVGIAIDNRLLSEENRQIMLQLKRSNIKLKALDETKDDFISMASHQLRTPLTSIKGYLSMVLDGDAGKLTAMEKQMLTQAFISSQRMVYLIADLLNVSRLKTGKFVIDPSPIDLATLIDEELKQLTETAASRKLKLEYNKPADFPILMLDETKIRQVIMNFVDNAIYYTPAGGRIKVELRDTPHSIELRVIDNGIGVPKAEQHHLFTKFYRAGNARKARPDGTGLGLFMAKKVVMGQGGAIVFDSKEGKGSTFGFTISKSKLAAPTPKA